MFKRFVTGDLDKVCDMKFSDDPKLEARVGKVCLVFARVEQEVGHVVQAAHGNWDLEASAEYLDYSSNSRLLLDWLKAVGQAYPKVQEGLCQLSEDLQGLKWQRDAWAHSAASIDIWLMMKEKRLEMMTDGGVDHGKLLHGKAQGHLDAPTEADLATFVERASSVGDAATEIARQLAELTEHGVREVRGPKMPKRQA